jgi:hypothetical protein
MLTLRRTRVQREAIPTRRREPKRKDATPRRKRRRAFARPDRFGGNARISDQDVASSDRRRRRCRTGDRVSTHPPRACRPSRPSVSSRRRRVGSSDAERNHFGGQRMRRAPSASSDGCGRRRRRAHHHRGVCRYASPREHRATWRGNALRRNELVSGAKPWGRPTGGRGVETHCAPTDRSGEMARVAVTRRGYWRGESSEGQGATGEGTRRTRVRTHQEHLPRCAEAEPLTATSAGGSRAWRRVGRGNAPGRSLRRKRRRRRAMSPVLRCPVRGDPNQVAGAPVHAGPGWRAMAARRSREGSDLRLRHGKPRRAQGGLDHEPEARARNVANPMVGSRAQQTCKSMRGENRRSRAERQGRNERRSWQTFAEGRASARPGVDAPRSSRWRGTLGQPHERSSLEVVFDAGTRRRARSAVTASRNHGE